MVPLDIMNLGTPSCVDDAYFTLFTVTKHAAQRKSFSSQWRVYFMNRNIVVRKTIGLGSFELRLLYWGNIPLSFFLTIIRCCDSTVVVSISSAEWSNTEVKCGRLTRKFFSYWRGSLLDVHKTGVLRYVTPLQSLWSAAHVSPNLGLPTF